VNAHGKTPVSDERLFQLRAIRGFFDPESIAIIGASADPTKFGSIILRYLRAFGFTGAVFPVNPKAQTIDGVRCYASVEELPIIPDLALIAVPGEAVESAVISCLERGTRAISVFAAGYAETGSDGENAQQRLRKLAGQYGAAILGPNSQGSARFSNGAVANFSSTFANGPKTPGNAAVVSQSGMLAGVLFDELSRGREGVGWLVATGNEAVVEASDIVEYLVSNTSADPIVVVLESVRSGRRLAAACVAAREAGRTLIVVKAGRSKVGQRAARSHTAAVASNDAVLEEAFRRLGVLRVETLADAAVLARALGDKVILPKGDRTLIMSNSGGMGAMMADAAERVGFSVPPLTPRSEESLATILPSFLSPANPVDLSVVARSASGLDHVLNAVLSDGANQNYDQAHLFIGFYGGDEDGLVKALSRAQDRAKVPIFVTLPGSTQELARRLLGVGIVSSPSPESGLHLASLLVGADRIGRSKSQSNSAWTIASDRYRPGGDARAPRGLPTYWDEQLEVMLDNVGLSHARTVICRVPEEAADAADQIGYPVVVKISSPQVPHRQEHHGVYLRLTDRDSVLEAARQLDAEFAWAADRRLLVQRMVPQGVEVFLSVFSDPQFGSAVTLASGGTRVELWRDAQVLLPPVSLDAVKTALASIRTWPLLVPYRGTPGVDVEAIYASVCAALRLHRGLSGAQVEINPLIVGPPGEGAYVVDLKIGEVLSEL
jgi:acetate---CoA ligase (ADP-forming)